MILIENMLAATDPMQHVIPHTLFHVGPLAFTNHMLMLLVSAILLAVGFPLMARNYPMVPSGVRNLVESMMVFIRNEVARPSLHEHTDRFMPFIWTVFFFILVNNVIGLVPLDPLSVLIFGRGHIAGTATAGISVTAGLALASFFVIHMAGMRVQIGHQRHKGRSGGAAIFVGIAMYFHGLVPAIPGVLGICLFPFLLVLELLGALVKPFALCIRLFANMLAGHVVLASLLILAPAIHNIADLGLSVPVILGCAALSCLELFVAFLQAYIFTFLTCMFIGAAVSPQH